MKRYKNQLIAAAVLSVLAVVGTIMNSRQASAQDGGPNVTIVSPIPLPVTGSVTSTVTGTVPVTGTVGLASGASVHVNNTVADPVRVRNVNDGIQPFQGATSCSTTISSVTGGCAQQVFNVPVGKRAVIEYFTGTATLNVGPGGLFVFPTVQTTIGGTAVVHGVSVLPLVSTNLGAATQWGQQVRLYADSGAIFVGVSFGGTGVAVTGTANFNFDISGYLVDVPFTP
jgi:hypothetical protein